MIPKYWVSGAEECAKSGAFDTMLGNPTRNSTLPTRFHARVPPMFHRQFLSWVATSQSFRYHSCGFLTRFSPLVTFIHNDAFQFYHTRTRYPKAFNPQSSACAPMLSSQLTLCRQGCLMIVTTLNLESLLSRVSSWGYENLITISFPHPPSLREVPTQLLLQFETVFFF